MFSSPRVTARRVISTTLTGLVALSISWVQPAQAVAVPNSPGFAQVNVQIIADNDYAVLLGDANNVTRLFYQNDQVWMSQLSAATSLDLIPQPGESYVYVLPMGGGGTEDWGGTIDGIDVTGIAGAQYATGRSPLGSASVTNTYLTFQNYLTNFVGHSSTIANGNYNVILSDVQSALAGASWGSAQATGSGSGIPPYYKTSGVCCGIGTTGKGWNFPSDSAVMFRYPISAFPLPISASSHQITISWTAPQAGDAPTYYAVQYKKSSDPDSAYQTFETTTSLTDTVTSLINGTQYSLRIAGGNSAGLGAFSAVKTATPTGPPDAPINLQASNNDTSTAVISFATSPSDGGSTISRYVLTQSPGGIQETLTSSVGGSLTFTGLTNGSTYSFTGYALNALGTSPISTSVTITIGSWSVVVPPPVIPPPAQLSTITPPVGLLPITQTPGGVPLTIPGNLIQPITNIWVGGVQLPPGSWTMSAGSITIALPAGILGNQQIQIFNGAMPLLPVINVQVLPAPPVSSAPSTGSAQSAPLTPTTTLPTTTVQIPTIPSSSIHSGEITRANSLLPISQVIQGFTVPSNVSSLVVTVNGEVIPSSVINQQLVLNTLITPHDNLSIHYLDPSGVVQLLTVPVEPAEVTLANINFADNSSTLTPSARSLLKRAIALIKAKGINDITLIGFTDSRGNNPLNKKLSLNRSASVAFYLTKALSDNGVSINYAGKGATKPVAANSTAGGMYLNRRVELVVKTR